MSRNQRRLRLALLFFSTGAVFCIAINLIGLYALREAGSSLGEWASYEGECVALGNPAAIEAGASLTIPATANNVFARSVYAGRGDCIVFVSFDMNVRELNTFIASTWVSSVERMSEPELLELRGILQSDVDWTFNSDTEFLYGRGQQALGSTQWIVLETTAPDNYRVYVVKSLF